MNLYREVAGFGEMLLIVTAVFIFLIGGGMGLVWLIGWLVGAMG